jgi:hypothetical protein
MPTVLWKAVMALSFLGTIMLLAQQIEPKCAIEEATKAFQEPLLLVDGRLSGRR